MTQVTKICDIKHLKKTTGIHILSDLYEIGILFLKWGGNVTSFSFTCVIMCLNLTVSQKKT